MSTMPGVGPLCPVCRTALVEEVVFCTACAMGHHRRCFQWADGCARYGCGGKVQTDRAPTPIDACLLDIGPSAVETIEPRFPRGRGRREIAVVNAHATLREQFIERPENSLLILVTALTVFGIHGPVAWTAGVGLMRLLFLIALAYVFTPAVTRVELDARSDTISILRILLGLRLSHKIGRVSDIIAIQKLARRRWVLEGGQFEDYAIELRFTSGKALRVWPTLGRSVRSAAAIQAAFVEIVEEICADLSRVSGLPVQPVRVAWDRLWLDRGTWLARLLSYLALAVYWVSWWLR